VTEPMTEHTTNPTSLVRTIDRADRRQRFRGWAVGVLIAALILALIIVSALALHVSSKSSEQTKAETQLRGIVHSQQGTIHTQAKTIASLVYMKKTSHAQTETLIRQETRLVITSLASLTDNIEAIDLIVIDSLNGASKATLHRDLQALGRYISSLP
jgi:hypothetical protein